MSNTVPRLSIRLLGAPEIQVEGLPLTVNHLKARALLYYLAATGRPHTRDHLAALLWSESSDRDARHSLRSDLYRLRRALRARGVDISFSRDEELISLPLAEYACDVIRFRQLVTQNSESALREATALYHGSLLEGFTLADAPQFEDWVRFEEMDLNRAYGQALDRLAAWAESRQAWPEAIGYAQRLVQIDPLAEDAQQHLIRLYVRNNAVGLALRQLQQFEAMLKHELAAAPSLEIQALVDEALQHRRDGGLRTATAPSSPERPTHLLPLVGREQLLARLLAFSRDPSARHGVTVLLQGEAGIGKTRLVDELVNRLSTAASPWLVLRGSCSPFDDLLSYGPFLEAFQNAAAGDLTDLLTASPEADPDMRGRFFYQVLQALRALTRSSSLLLAIDDLHWANSSTLNLFSFLATRLHDAPIMLVGTVQNAESIPALQRLITWGRRHAELHLLSLTPLSLEAVTTLLRDAGLSSTSVSTLAEWLHERSSGSPFVFGEILSQLQADAILMPVNSGWQIDAGRWLRWRATFALPETTLDLVAWRLTNLTVEAHRLLAVLAVAGRPLPFMLLRDTPDLQTDQLIPSLDDLASRRLIVETENETYELPHHLLREAVLRRLSHIHHRLIHRQLAAVFESRLDAPADYVLRQVALHAVAGEDIDRARRYGLQVLDDLPQDFSAAETVGFFHQLYDLLAPTASREELLRLTHALGRLHYSLGHIEAATHWHRQHLVIAREADDRSAQVTACFELSELALATGDHLAAVKQAEAGLAICALPAGLDPADQSGRGHRLLGAALAMEGSDLLGAENHLRQALTAQKHANRPNELCATLFELGNVAAQRGELDRALESYTESAHLAEAARVNYYLALAHNNLAYHHLLLGQLDAARRSAGQGLKLAETFEMLGVLLYLYSTQGEIHLYQAEWSAATELFQRGLSLAEELNHLERQAGYRGGLALAARGQHDLDRTIVLLEEGLALIASQGYWHLQSRLQIWLAETLLQSERVSEAWLHLQAALTTVRQHGRAQLLIQAERLQAQLLAARGEWPRADAHLAEVLQHAESFGLAIEVARTQAAWGAAALRYSPIPAQGYSLLAEARALFIKLHARADLEAMPHSQAA